MHGVDGLRAQKKFLPSTHITSDLPKASQQKNNKTVYQFSILIGGDTSVTPFR